MNRLTSGKVALLALLTVVGCQGEPTESIRGDTARLDASPSQLFLQLGENKPVDVTAVDGQGNQISSAYEVSDVGSGITVVRDSTFLPIFVNDSTLSVPPEAPTFRYQVTATSYVATTFKVSANGKEIIVPVQVIPRNVVQVAISNLTPALGETVTITAPDGITFAPTTTVTVADTAAVQPFAVTVAPDGKSITFLPPPNMLDGVLIISDVTSAGSPNELFAPATTDRLTTPELKVLDANISNLTPGANQAVTVTLNNATFDPASTFAIGVTPGFPLSISGNTASFIPTPGSLGTLTVNGVVPDTLAGYVLPLTSTDTVTVGPASEVAGTDDPSTAPSLSVPNPGQNLPFFDVPDFTATVDHFYKLVITQAGDYTINLNWDIGSDLDLILCDDAACSNPDFTAATGDQPEEATFTLAAGTYYVVAEDFGGDAAGATITIAVSR